MKIFFAPAIAAFAALIFSASSVKATTVYALTDGGDVLTFDHATPDTITNDVAITGLGGYELLAIDVRPTVQAAPGNPGAGTLWGIGKSGTNFQLFVINPATGAASAIGAPIAAGINGTPANTQWGFDFNPSADRIRLVNSANDDNYRLNPNNGQLFFTDVALAYASGDANFGTAPQIDAAAYTTVPFGGITSLYYIDSNLNILATSASPNTGAVQTVGPLGTDIGEPNGFDIYRNLALLSVPVIGASALYSVDLSSGTATLIGNFPALTAVRGLAISISDPIDQKPVVTLIGRTTRTTRASQLNVRFRATDDSGVVAASFRAVRQTQGFKSVYSSTSVYLASVRHLKTGTNPVLLLATDPAGHRTQVRVVIKRLPAR